MRTPEAVFVLFASASSAVAANVGPIVDLPLAALVGERDARLAPEERRELIELADGRRITRQATISVRAEAIECRESDVAIAERSCVLTFGSDRVTLTGLRAHEMVATLKEAGAPSEGAAGSIFTFVSDLRCTVFPLQVLAKAGGGAACTFTTTR